MMKNHLLRLGALLLAVLSIANIASTVATPSPPASPSSDAASASAVQMSSNSFSLRWNVAAAGGETMASESESFRLSATIGQPVVGAMEGDLFKHRVGYWQPWTFRIYLPLVLRS